MLALRLTGALFVFPIRNTRDQDGGGCWRGLLVVIALRRLVRLDEVVRGDRRDGDDEKCDEEPYSGDVPCPEAPQYDAAGRAAHSPHDWSRVTHVPSFRGGFG